MSTRINTNPSNRVTGNTANLCENLKIFGGKPDEKWSYSEATARLQRKLNRERAMVNGALEYLRSLGHDIPTT